MGCRLISLIVLVQGYCTTDGCIACRFGATRYRVKTGGTFAHVCRASAETAVAFAGEKWAYLVRFSVAEVPTVSTVAVEERAVVMVVSCWPASVPAVVSLVSKLPRRCALRAKKLALRGPMVGVSAKKFAQRAENTPISGFLGLLGELFRGWAAGGRVLGELFRGWAAGGRVLGELFRGWAAGGRVLGEFFRGWAAGGRVLGEFFRARAVGAPCWASFVAPTDSAPGVVATLALHVGGCGGFAALGAGWRRVVGVSDP